MEAKREVRRRGEPLSPDEIRLVKRAMRAVHIKPNKIDGRRGLFSDQIDVSPATITHALQGLSITFRTRSRLVDGSRRVLDELGVKQEPSVNEMPVEEALAFLSGLPSDTLRHMVFMFRKAGVTDIQIPNTIHNR